MSLRLPLDIPSNPTTPSIFAISAWSFGLRASNNSATRGRPPVISFVLDNFLGVLAKYAPPLIFCLSLTERCAPVGTE